MKKCLIVVDFQKDFVDGSLGFKGAEKFDSIIESKILHYLNNNYDIIFTKDTHLDNYLETQEGRNLPILHCQKGSPGHEIYGRVGAYQEDAVKVFEKETFGSLELVEFVKKQKYDEVEIAGLVTNICVIANAVIIKTALPEALVIVDTEAVGSYDEDLHYKTLDVLKGLQVVVK